MTDSRATQGALLALTAAAMWGISGRSSSNSRLRMVASSIVGVVATAEPGIGAVAAAILLDQSLNRTQWIGVLVVLVAVASVQRFGLSDVRSPTPIA